MMVHVYRALKCQGYCRLIGIFMLGVACMMGLQLWWSSAKPSPVVVQSIDVHVEKNGNRILEVASSGPPSRECLRVTQHLLYRVLSDGIVDYVPLGMAVNGMGFGSRPNFKVTLEVPEFVAVGMWDYVNRSVYFCSVFPGFTKITQVVSANTPVELR